MDQIEEALYGADFGVQTTQEITEQIQAAFKQEKQLRGQDALVITETVLKRVLEGSEGHYQPTHPLEVISLVGVNGAGKTTTAAKLAQHFREQGSKVILGACDTFRAAANEQIKTWCERLGVDLIASHHGADAAAVAFDSYQAAQSRGAQVLLLDTAGRLHNKSHLMEELKKLNRVLKKQDPEAPHQTWLVVDGSLGSNSIEQARAFHEQLGLTGIIITKLDGTSRGGALVGIYRELKLPIYFVGLGEQAEDLQPFNIDNYLKAIFESEEASGR
ncbi:MAG: signal recognition particle-docking protein FtsY [Verrucomicrobia bacterium 21-51-4]|nr:MAG: signal recognition particle-docking protein FtsY [Verrucomicrobia bacterium 21-51-4]